MALVLAVVGSQAVAVVLVVEGSVALVLAVVGSQAVAVVLAVVGSAVELGG